MIPVLHRHVISGCVLLGLSLVSAHSEGAVSRVLTWGVNLQQAAQAEQKKHSVTLKWEAPVARRGLAGPVSYNIYRSDIENGPYRLIAKEVRALTYIDTTVQSGHTYYYKVTGMDAWGRESTAAKMKATLP